MWCTGNFNRTGPALNAVKFLSSFFIASIAWYKGFNPGSEKAP